MQCLWGHLFCFLSNCDFRFNTLIQTHSLIVLVGQRHCCWWIKGPCWMVQTNLARLLLFQFPLVDEWPTCLFKIQCFECFCFFCPFKSCMSVSNPMFLNLKTLIFITSSPISYFFWRLKHVKSPMFVASTVASTLHLFQVFRAALALKRQGPGPSCWISASKLQKTRTRCTCCLRSALILWPGFFGGRLCPLKSGIFNSG